MAKRPGWKCPECGTSGYTETPFKAGNMARRHNESRHDGRSVAYPTTLDD